MTEIFREAGDEDASSGADPDDGSRPSVEAVLSAFRAASRSRASQPSQASTEKSGPSPAEPVEETSEPDLEPASETEAEPGCSPTAMLEETLTAFRKAERRAETARPPERRSETSHAEKSETAPTETSSSEEKPTEQAPPGEKTSEEGLVTQEAPTEDTEADEEEEGTGAAEDLAQAFRRVLSDRDGPGSSAPEEGGHGGEGEPPSGPVGPGGAPEEGPPPSSDRPEASFLWVTVPPGEQQPAAQDADRLGEASVPADRLSGPRAQEAEAFLLRGEGEDPYRLLRRIRGHPEAEVYLKPVFWRRDEEEQSPVSEHVDGQWREGDREAFGELREKAAAIHRRIGTVMEGEDMGEGGPELRVLRFVATRDPEFTPRRTEGSGDELVYPKLTPLLEQDPHSGRGELAEILSKTARRIRRRQ